MKKYFFFFLYGKIRIKKLSIKNYLIKKLEIYKNKFINLYNTFNVTIYTNCNTSADYIEDNKLIPKISYQQNKHSRGSLKNNNDKKIELNINI